MGVFWALCSVLLVSIAQLLMRYAMQQLPPGSLAALFSGPGPVMILACGVGGYLASMGCWFMALRRIPLSRAYSLLSLSYVLVWGAALLLPGFGEHFSRAGAAGVVLIVAGVMVIFSPQSGRR
ncbi:4-amino-4-deoxy-L-arabinose-phosphoundecaprenol flippase subunit ArnF [Shimwellia blattae]|uniref:Probable 4-amino-4-deoxy-L-arabinose-phosphoundecaprenol flippase subunit ArnF n=1 Tax=Shimwellia blattae (strain ATCC 29907 / DSM 4481 / JCM 1650 / NBRC 105725 / CDC 9005-74) TaxID=630626 RepID=I2B7L8_SHIBC|nr:conserved hypothetical membrane protein [Shimwellia blattae DSM 4481 = NBRC 105725]GAB80101.1 putative 4-amino-4-deoxy-L-arabinose-phosphoundecaprenol flippase subunit ArnF [Shimwellia blattae DSM 4481 = NBRC 105725]VDY63991.1 Undecaprenyl phosphate-aminoarabinose flippase subunit ArnF [Shimwellia blattae]VEC22126.1 Undecaprenyl phosphate-aminoarabinose flippase subunit ArnF [Shimwellia blattae]